MKLVQSIVLFTSLIVWTENTVSAQMGVVVFAGEYLGGKFIDLAYDTASGKPNIRFLEQRLIELEQSAATREGVRAELTAIRNQLENTVSKKQFRQFVAESTNRMRVITKRLDDVEQQLALLQVQRDDDKNGTRNAIDGFFFLRRAEELNLSGDHFKALANINCAIDLSPDEVAVHIAKAEHFMQLDNFGGAMVSADRCLQIAPSDNNVKLLHAECALALWLFDTAVETLSKVNVEQIDAVQWERMKSIKVKSLVGKSHPDYPRCEKGNRKNLDIAKQIDPDAAEVYYFLGKRADEEGWTPEGVLFADYMISMLKIAVEKDPEYLQARYFLANRLSLPGRMQDIDASNQHYREILKRIPDDMWRRSYVLTLMAYNLQKQRKDRESLEYLDKAVKLDPLNSYAHRCRQWACLELGRKEEAASHYAEHERIEQMKLPFRYQGFPDFDPNIR